jgi:hypothetical protein
MENKKILVFSHNYIDHNWFGIVSEQLELLIKSELYSEATNIFYCCYANNEFDFYKFYNLVRKYDQQQKINIINHALNDQEKQTLIFMQQVCKNYPDAHLLYYHTKGVTTKYRNNDVQERNVTSWRKMMEYFNIENWRKCIEKLNDGNDVCGVLYGYWISSHHQGNYYAGNFWWTNSGYFNKLPDMEHRDNRMGCESLITSIPHRWHSFYSSSEISLYEKYFDPEEYRKFF